LTNHLDDLIQQFPALESCRKDIESAFVALARCFRRGKKILLCGNGGSAADCEHWSAELTKGFQDRRPLSAQWREKLGAELGGKLQGALPAIPLPSLMCLSTAFANDVDPEMVFAQGVWALGAEGDLLVGISTSGNSTNVLLAAEVARAKGLATIGLTGESGGKLVGLVQVCIRAPETEVHRVQQYHLPIYHCLCLMLEAEFFS